jgi:SAM-dependent methyltransferase
MTKWQPSAGVYDHPLDYEAIFSPGLQDLAFYRRVAAQAGGSALELGCGTGRLLWPLRQAGLAVEGLDQSQAMLDRCRQNGQALGLSGALHHGDWRDFDLGRVYQCLLLPFNGLQHLTQPADLEAFFRCARSHLQPGGLFGLDVHLPQARLLAREAGENFGVEAGPETSGGERVVAEQSRYDALAQVLTQTWTLAAPDGGTREISLGLRQFFPQELRALLAAHGFEVLSATGGFQDEPLEAESLKQVLCCRRTPG